MRIMYWSSVVCSSDLPESAWVLVDAAQRRVHLLEETVDALGWRDRVIVRHGRAEVLGHEPGLRASADLVTSRSFGPPAVAAECGAAFLVPGGVLAVTEPPDPGEARWDYDGLAQLGLVRGPSAARSAERGVGQGGCRTGRTR